MGPGTSSILMLLMLFSGHISERARPLCPRVSRNKGRQDHRVGPGATIPECHVLCPSSTAIQTLLIKA